MIRHRIRSCCRNGIAPAWRRFDRRTRRPLTARHIRTLRSLTIICWYIHVKLPAQNINQSRHFLHFLNMSKTQNSDISALLSTPILDPLPASAVAAVLSQPPFAPVAGLVNSRWLPTPIGPKYIFRSGAFDFLTPEGKRTLVDLGIKTIFDLRSEKERLASPDPAIEGIESRWEPNTLENVVTEKTQTPDPKGFNVGMPTCFSSTS